MTWLDATLMQWAAAHRFPLGNQLARAVMAVGTSPVVVAAAVLLGLSYVVVRRRFRLAAGMALGVLGSTVLAEALKPVFGRARPAASLALVHAEGWSMPSSVAAVTAAGAAALYVGLTWRDPRRRRLVGGVLVVGVTAIGLCLVYLGVHWPTDVVAGWTLGATIGAGAAAVRRPRRSRHT